MVGYFSLLLFKKGTGISLGIFKKSSFKKSSEAHTADIIY